MATPKTGRPRGRPRGTSESKSARDAFIHRLMSDLMADLGLTQDEAASAAAFLLSGDIGKAPKGYYRKTILAPTRGNKRVTLDVPTGPDCKEWAPLSIHLSTRVEAWWEGWLRDHRHLTPSANIVLAPSSILEIYKAGQVLNSERAIELDHMLTLAEVEALLRRKKTWIYAEVRAGRFPAPDAGRWYGSEIAVYLHERRIARHQQFLCPNCGHVNVSRPARGEPISGEDECRKCGVTLVVPFLSRPARVE